MGTLRLVLAGSAVTLGLSSVTDALLLLFPERTNGLYQWTRVIPVAVMLGAVLVCVADLIGRTVIAPAQLGAGLMTAVIGTPYFLYLLIRTRR